MSLLVISPGKDPEAWVKALKEQHPGLNIYVYPEDHDKEEVEFALTWKHPRGIFKNYPNLKVIASMGAGVDHITSDEELPENIKITKVVDDRLEEDMGTFVLSLILAHQRNLLHYRESQLNEKWEPVPYTRNNQIKVGILGIGNLGQRVAHKLLQNDFQVIGFSRNKKEIENVESFAGEDELDEFLEQSNILVNMLPLTPNTEKILDKELFEKLPKGAYLINVARGEHLVEQDLLAKVDDGHLSGAALDVFWEEPIRDEHPFWKHPKIRVTPHIASVTHPKSVVPQIIENYERLQDREPLKNEVKRDIGY
ncbi:2-hydroxyacid dehydrogenase [Salegentibacter maritimus]|uniref:2-hydroxyacid dehydrogenase n=1 Tax=Salegentibacter maritimus TaxID=2794347 RepID=UPI0018E488BA|nr:glyoxylate/hydroxypyruvate reductase A [Salegentibacter maritimus]MBI6116075.1 glyoxylate/hydroxypyruvate reductase A [Salegentibacter maritimus]